MPDLPNSSRTQLQQSAVHCYLSSILAIADCLAEICPEVGVAFRNRWLRFPQRIGFDPSPEALEASRRTFEGDIRAFAEFTGKYLNNTLPIVKSISDTGSRVADAVLERAASHVVLLETLAASIDTAADMDAPPEIREMLEHQSAGLRNCAEQANRELLPLVSRLRALISDCEKVAENARGSLLVDTDTGFLNEAGLHQELDFRLRDHTSLCVVAVDCTSSKPFWHIAPAVAVRLADQFRPNDCLARLSGRFVVIFDGEEEQAVGRLEQIKRSLSGDYVVGNDRVSVEVDIHVSRYEADSSFQDLLTPELAAHPA